jgi:hypothetical protein
MAFDGSYNEETILELASIFSISLNAGFGIFL